MSPVDLNACQIAASASSTCGGTVAETARGSCSTLAFGLGFGLALVAVVVLVAVAVPAFARVAAVVAGFFAGLIVTPSGAPARAPRRAACAKRVCTAASSRRCYVRGALAQRGCRRLLRADASRW